MRVIWLTAAWCGPCKKMKPVVERIQNDCPTVVFEVLDIDTPNGHAAAVKYGVVTVPTFIKVDWSEEPIARVTGALPAGKFKEALGIS